MISGWGKLSLLNTSARLVPMQVMGRQGNLAGYQDIDHNYFFRISLYNKTSYMYELFHRFKSIVTLHTHRIIMA